MNIKTFTALLIIFVFSSCNTSRQQGDQNKSEPAKQDNENYNGVKKFYENGVLKKEVTYKEGIKEGLCKNYYDDGRLKRTIWYSNNLRQDTAKWFYTDGSVYRATPYNNDRIHGIQTKYYRSGRKMAELPYKNGLRLPGLKEYYDNGLEVGNIPKIEIIRIDDRYYQSDSIVTITACLSNRSTNVKFYRGGLKDGAFDPGSGKDITAAEGKAYLELYRSNKGNISYIDLVAEYVTRFRNKEIITRRVQLPYTDLK